VARLSPITIALSLLLFLLFSAFVYLTSRPRPRPAVHGMDPDVIGERNRDSGPSRSWVDLRPQQILSPGRVSDVVADDGVSATEQFNAWRSRQLVRMSAPTAALMGIYRRYRLARRMDENAFEALKMSDVDREAIRKINFQHKLTKRALSGLSVEEGSKLLESDEAMRRTAIESVIGADAARRFFNAESSVEAEAVGENSSPSLVSAPEVGSDPADQRGDAAIPVAEAPAQDRDEASSPTATPPTDPAASDAGS
jgi:hypothetical protein